MAKKRAPLLALHVGLLLLSVTLARASERELLQEVSVRIVGGQNALLNRYPYAVSLRDGSGAHFCGGVLIAAAPVAVVATAAHCVYTSDTGRKFPEARGRRTLLLALWPVAGAADCCCRRAGPSLSSHASCAWGRQEHSTAATCRSTLAATT